MVASQSGINGSVVELAALVKRARAPADRGHVGRAHRAGRPPAPVRATARRPRRRRAGQRRAVRRRTAAAARAAARSARSPRSPRRCWRSWWSPRSCDGSTEAGRGTPDLPLRQRPRRGRAQPRPRVAVRRAPPAHRLTRIHEETRRCRLPPSTRPHSTVAPCCAAPPPSACSPLRPRPAQRLRHQRRRRRQRAGRRRRQERRPTRSGVKEDAPLEVVIFNGGYGDKYATDVHEPLYKKAFPKAEIKHQATPGRSPRSCSRGSPAATRRTFVNNSGTEADGLRRAGRRRPAAGPHRAVGRAVGRRPEQEGPRHGRAGHRRGRARSTASRTSCTTSPPSSASGTPASCSRTTAGPPPKTWDEFIALLRRRSRPRASRPYALRRARTPPTTSGT